MRASVNTADQTVRVGEAAWPFRVDLRRGCALIALDDSEYAVRAQSWQEKLSMSRFLSLGESFLQSSFLDCCVGTASKVDARHSDILTALAMWINRPDDEVPGLVLDHKQLSRVTLEVCRSMGVGPAAIADLPVPEVESLWRYLESSRGVARQATQEQEFDYKVVVVPDAAAGQEAVPKVEEQKSDRKTKTPAKEAPQSIAAQARFRMSFNDSMLERRGSAQHAEGPSARQNVAAAKPVEADRAMDQVDPGPRDPYSAATPANAAVPNLHAELDPAEFTASDDALFTNPPQSGASAPALQAGYEHAEPFVFMGAGTPPRSPIQDAGVAATTVFPMEFSGFLAALPANSAPLREVGRRSARSRSAADLRLVDDSRIESIGLPVDKTLLVARPSERGTPPQPELDMESLLNEFCRRLDEAATDLGIFEEA